MNKREISKFSVKDAENYPQYEQMLERVIQFIEQFIDESPPNMKSITLYPIFSLTSSSKHEHP